MGSKVPRSGNVSKTSLQQKPPPEPLPGRGPGILYVVLTHKKNYLTKLAAVMSTWSKDVLEEDSLLLVGDQASTSPEVVSASPPCGNDHDDQLICKAGIAIQQAYDTWSQVTSQVTCPVGLSQR